MSDQEGGTRSGSGSGISHGQEGGTGSGAHSGPEGGNRSGEVTRVGLAWGRRLGRGAREKGELEKTQPAQAERVTRPRRDEGLTV